MTGIVGELQLESHLVELDHSRCGAMEIDVVEGSGFWCGGHTSIIARSGARVKVGCNIDHVGLGTFVWGWDLHGRDKPTRATRGDVEPFVIYPVRYTNILGWGGSGYQSATRQHTTAPL